MNCAICGAFNEEGSTVCSSCGNNLEVYVETKEQVVGNNVNQASNYQPTSNFNCLTYIGNSLIKPFIAFKENEENLAQPKNALILTGIVSVVMMIINFIKAIISAIFVKRLDYSTFEYKTELDFSQLKDLEYLELIGKNLLVYIAIIFAIAVVYYLGSLVAKKTPKFMRLVSITATSYVPYVLLAMVLSPILGKIWSDLSLLLTIVGVIYSVVIFISLVNEEIKFENKNNSIYFNLCCITVLFVATYYVGIKSAVSGLMKIFG